MRAAQAHRVQFHHHQIVDHRFRQLGMLSHLKGDVVKDRKIGEQGAELKQHAHSPPHAEHAVAIELVGS